MRNRIAGLPVDFGFNKDDDYYSIANIQHYPKGGGFQATHEDPLEPQRCVVALTLSTLGEEYHQGGLYIEREGDVVVVDEHVLLDDPLRDILSIYIGAVGLRVPTVNNGIDSGVQAVEHGLRVDAVGGGVLAKLVDLVADRR